MAGDMDEPGVELRNKLAAYFGEARCRIVEWRLELPSSGEEGPGVEGFSTVLTTKDANEMLIEHGVDAVLQCINHAQPCPIIGVETVDDYRQRTKQIWEHGVTPGKTVGWGEFDSHVQFEPGRTGLLMFVIVHPAKLQKGEKIETLYNASGSAEFRNRADYGLVLVNDDEHNPSNTLHRLKIIVDKVRDDAMGHKGVCYLSFDASNYRHGIVQPVYCNGSVVKLHMLGISSNCWLDQMEQLEIF